MRRDLIYLISFVFVSSLALTNRANAGLVAWWRLDEGSGTVALDSSGNGNDARFQGAPAWVESGKFGKTLDVAPVVVRGWMATPCFIAYATCAFASTVSFSANSFSLASSIHNCW